MNVYVVAKATQGFADTIIESGEDVNRGVAIAYDVRHMSKEFAELAAEVFAGNGIKVYLHKDIRPTPVLSYTIKTLKTVAGVMVTASHNPKQYNGYKAYWDDGSQILEETANKILDHIASIEKFEDIKKMPLKDALESGLVEYVDDQLIEDYINDTLSLTINDENIDKDVVIVYSPLNGTGNVLVREILKRRGFNNVHIVEEQELPDADFTTVGYPNPEDPKAFKYSIELGKKVDADLLLATDPDADRTAVEVKDENGEYVFLNGNKIGSLLTNYILSALKEKGQLPENGVVVKSIVTGDLSKAICDDFGIEMREVLTGFKNIYEVANEFAGTKEKEFILGYEESIGYSYGTFVGDKDAVSSSMMIAEMTAYYKSKGKSLLDVLKDLYKKYGVYNEKVVSITLEGADGQALIKRIMEDFRNESISEIGEMKLVKTIDYSLDDTGLQKSNVLKYYFDDKSWYALRPSGTEPKIKIYIYTVGKDFEDSELKIEQIEKAARDKISAVK